MARLAGAVLILVLALGMVRWGEPFATAPRPVVAGTPSPPGLFGAFGIKLKGGQRLCATQVTVPDDARTLEFTTGTYSRPGPPLTVSLDGPGYHHRVKVDGGYEDNTARSVPVKQAPAGGAIATLCVRNDSRRAVNLLGTTEPRTRSRPTNTVDGRRIEANVALTLYGAGPRSLASRTGEVLAHAAAFRPWFLGEPVLWLLLLLVLVGLPVALIAALGLGLRESGAVVPTLADREGVAPAPRGVLDRTGATFGELLERPRELWARFVAWHHSLSARGQLWPLALVTFLAWVWLARYGLRNHSFSIDQEGYVSTSRYVRDLFPGSLFELQPYSRGLQRLHTFLLAGSFELFGTAGGFNAFKWLNALCFASAAPAGYVLARHLGVRRSLAYVAATLCVVMPWAVTTTFILAEGIAYPVFLWLCILVVRALGKPSLGREAAVWAMLAIAPFARTSFIALPAVYVGAVVVQELRFGGLRALPRRLVTRHRLTTGLVTLGTLVVAFRLATTPDLHTDVRNILGGYEDQTDAAIRWGAMLDSVAERFARLAAGLALVPAILGLPWIARQLWRPTSPERHALAAFGGIAALAIFYTTWNSTFDERYFMYLAPVLVVAALVALDRREIGTRGVIAGAVVTLAILLSAPWADAGDAYRFFLLPAETFWAAKGLTGTLTFIVLVGALAAAAAVAIRGRAPRVLWGLLVLVIAVQVWQTRYANANFVTQAGESTGPGFAQRAWVDEAVPGRGDAAVLLVGQGHTDDYTAAVFRETAYWNPEVRTQVLLPDRNKVVPQLGDVRKVKVDDETGRLEVDGGMPEHLVQPTRFRDIGVAGDPVALSPYLPLELIRPADPPQATYRVEGVEPDGFLKAGRQASIHTWRGGCLLLPVYALPDSAKQRLTVRVLGGRTLRDSLPAGGRKVVKLPVRAGDDVRLAASGAIGLEDKRTVSIGLDSLAFEPRC